MTERERRERATRRSISVENYFSSETEGRERDTHTHTERERETKRERERERDREGERELLKLKRILGDQWFWCMGQ